MVVTLWDETERMGIFGSSAKAKAKKAAESALTRLRQILEVVESGSTDGGGSDDTLERINFALTEAKEACIEAGIEDEPLLSSGAAYAKVIMDERLAASQAASVAEAVASLQGLMDAAASSEGASVGDLDALDAALPEARENGVPSALMQEAQGVLKRARARHSEKGLREAIASRSQKALHRELAAARKSTPKGRKGAASGRGGRGGGSSAARDGGEGGGEIDPGLVEEADRLLQTLRRQDAAAARLRRSIEMSGPAALAREVEAARSDPHMPPGELRRAERALVRRLKEQRLQKWLRVLQEARQALAVEAHRAWQAEQLAGWHAELVSGEGELSAQSEAELKRALELLTHEVKKRLARAERASTQSRAQSKSHAVMTDVEPAWVFLVREAYERFPSPALSAAQLARAKASSKQAASSQLSRTVLRALMELIRVYHPDKNAQFGRAWSAIAEELTKLAVMLYQEYQTRLEYAA